MMFLPVNIGFESYCDHYIISTINKSITNNEISFLIFDDNNKPPIINVYIIKK